MDMVGGLGCGCGCEVFEVVERFRMEELVELVEMYVVVVCAVDMCSCCLNLNHRRRASLSSNPSYVVKPIVNDLALPSRLGATQLRRNIQQKIYPSIHTIPSKSVRHVTAAEEVARQERWGREHTNPNVSRLSHTHARPASSVLLSGSWSSRSGNHSYTCVRQGTRLVHSPLWLHWMWHRLRYRTIVAVLSVSLFVVCPESRG